MDLVARRSAESRPKSAPRVLHRPPYPRGTGVGVAPGLLFIFSPAAALPFGSVPNRKPL